MLVNCLAVGIGGFVGSILRYLCGLLVPHPSFPWPTLAINVIGSFAIAVFAGLVLRGLISDEHLSLMLRVGLCGGFTTFSTFSLEAADLASQGHMGAAIAYALASCVLCVLAALAGTWITRVS